MGIRGVGRLPVVSREDNTHLIGLIRRADIIHAYNLALTRKSDFRERAKLANKSALDGSDFVELLITDGDKVIGKKVEHVASCMPEESILISILRDGNVIVPHGATVFKVGDLVTAFVHKKDVEALHKCFHGENVSIM